jgi:hypothetical protein
MKAIIGPIDREALPASRFTFSGQLDECRVVPEFKADQAARESFLAPNTPIVLSSLDHPMTILDSCL